VLVQLEVEQLSHVDPVRPAPPVVVHGGREIGRTEQRRDVIEDGSQQGVHGIAVSPAVVVVVPEANARSCRECVVGRSASDDNGTVRGRCCERRQISRIAGQDPIARAGQQYDGCVNRIAGASQA
jgi:hypothetical protein